MNLFLGNDLYSHYDWSTIYSFYEALDNEINSLFDYCLDNHYKDVKLLDYLIRISKLYKSLVMEQLDNNNYM